MTIKFERFFQNAIMVKGFEVPNPEHAELLSMDPVTHFALSKDPINLGLSNAKSFCVNTNAFWVDAKKAFAFGPHQTQNGPHGGFCIT